MKTLIIDPFLRTITEADHDGSLESIYKLTHCDTFTAVGIDNHGGALFLDDEGLLKDLTKQAFFMIDTYSEPLAGYAMTVGVNGAGETVEAEYTVEQLKARVKWITLDEIKEQF